MVVDYQTEIDRALLRATRSQTAEEFYRWRVAQIVEASDDGNPIKFIKPRRSKQGR